MPPSTHYLNLLNLQQPEENVEFSAEDISRELELFTNSNFLDSTELFNIDFPQQYPSQPTPLPIQSQSQSQSQYTPAQSQSPSVTKSEGEPTRSLEEEDKRRRNTAASARFRIKKKQREQALQESNKAILDRNAQLEQRVKELELENKWLRSLIKNP